MITNYVSYPAKTGMPRSIFLIGVGLLLALAVVGGALSSFHGGVPIMAVDWGEMRKGMRTSARAAFESMVSISSVC